jgi:hypothetical protein
MHMQSNMVANYCLYARDDANHGGMSGVVVLMRTVQEMRRR